MVCETDIHGAITALLAEAAGMDEARTFFADWTVRHPDNENGELLQHCGPWPVSVAKEKPTIGYPLAFDHPGAVEAEAKHGDMTLCRFDGDNGEYALLLGHAKGVEGPYTKGTYVWVEVENLKRLEAKLVERAIYPSLCGKSTRMWCRCSTGHAKMYGCKTGGFVGSH